MDINTRFETRNGVEVIVDEDFLVHMKAHSELSEELIAEAISNITYIPEEGKTFSKEMFSLDLGRVIGKDNLVQVRDGDEVVLLNRPGREILSRIVLKREAEDTSLINVLLCTLNGATYVCTAFLGVLAPKEEEDPTLTEEEAEEVKKFWATHALVKNF